ncbi:MAG: helix-turn-helix domain-containing protein [Clostridiales bacterium]|nr:helix-turn-helix domain-containing protein [Clostridiales bacterium]
MKQSDFVIEQLARVSGLIVRRTTAPSDMPQDGVWQSETLCSTVFTVPSGNKVYAFEINGCGEAERVTAALARELASGMISKSAAVDEPVRAFLDGSGDVPQGVHLGKSDYYVFALYSKELKKNVREYLNAMAYSCDFVADMGEGITAFCKRLDNDSDYQSAGEFAAVLKENITEEIKGNVKIGVGGVAHGASELPQYYAYAKSALVNGAEYDPKSDIYSYKEYALIKALSELSEATKEKYVKTVLDRNYRDVTADEELMAAADAFLKHSLNISEASRNMYVHRNTLIYRLDKLEKLTGLNIRNFNDAVTFKTACLIHKML